MVPCLSEREITSQNPPSQKDVWVNSCNRKSGYTSCNPVGRWGCWEYYGRIKSLYPEHTLNKSGLVGGTEFVVKGRLPKPRRMDRARTTKEKTRKKKPINRDLCQEGGV